MLGRRSGEDTGPAASRVRTDPRRGGPARYRGGGILSTRARCSAALASALDLASVSSRTPSVTVSIARAVAVALGLLALTGCGGEPDEQVAPAENNVAAEARGDGNEGRDLAFCPPRIVSEIASSSPSSSRTARAPSSSTHRGWTSRRWASSHTAPAGSTARVHCPDAAIPSLATFGSATAIRLHPRTAKQRQVAHTSGAIRGDR